MNWLIRLYIRSQPHRGQTMTEYVLILSAIALVTFVGLKDILADELSEFIVKVEKLLL
jgi:Flp pilus assembly pilin Flp